MRIIAGEKRGLQLISPPGKEIRPTYDRVREAVFGKLQFLLKGKTILDLFAGSGALGIEALSRGADVAWFVDQNSGAIQIVEANVSKAGYTEKSRITKKEFKLALKMFQNRIKFDIVFIDPPYASNYYETVLQLLYTYRLLNDKALLVLESDTPLIIETEGYLQKETRKYGKSFISYLEYNE